MNIGSDLSFFSLIMGASLPVQLVMIILVFASIISWKFIYLKIKFLKRSEENSQEFEKFFWSGGDLARLYDSLGTNGKDMTGLAEIFRSGYKEYLSQKEHKSFDKKSIESVRRAMRAAYNREIDTLDQHLPFLASVGSVSPYIGLFGTVWGIMNSFQSIAISRNTSLAIVAPGIAEALFATALGLLAAIPAVVAYNKFNSDSQRYFSKIENFSKRFLSII